MLIHRWLIGCRARRRVVPVVIALMASVWAGCSLEDPGIPALTSPSGFAAAVTMSANRDSLPRDGGSQSVITVTWRDASRNPVAGRLRVTASIGTLSQDEIVTDADGHATFAYTAPAATTVGNEVQIQVSPISTGGETGLPRVLTIALTGVFNAEAPTPLFTSAPAAPVLRQDVVLDASTTTDEGDACLDACTYSWNFDGEATASGRVVTYQFQSVRTYPVTLTVTDNAGSVATLTQNVVVTQGTAPTASFTFSPTAPGQFETINFTAEASRVGETSRTITSYEWSLGDGETKTGVTERHSYSVLGTYAVVLTVTDSAGVQGTSSQTITVVNGVTATFIASNPTDGSLEVVFNAEESRGSNSGFGGRNTISNYIWHFGIPGTTAVVETTSPIISQTFLSAGTYTVTLTVEDSAGRRQTSNQEIAVVN
jgi:PKD repeat protein